MTEKLECPNKPRFCYFPKCRNTCFADEEQEGCTCQGCGRKYTVDLIVPDELWESIKPEGKAKGAGLLCGECIFERIERVNGFAGFQLTITR